MLPLPSMHMSVRMGERWAREETRGRQQVGRNSGGFNHATAFLSVACAATLHQFDYADFRDCRQQERARFSRTPRAASTTALRGIEAKSAEIGSQVACRRCVHRKRRVDEQVFRHNSSVSKPLNNRAFRISVMRCARSRDGADTSRSPKARPTGDGHPAAARWSWCCPSSP